jgi:hypothetical protein
VCCVLIGVSPYLVPLPPGDDPIAVTVIIIIIIIIIIFWITVVIDWISHTEQDANTQD